MLNNWINTKYLNQKTINKIRNSFKKAKPFSHIALKDFFDNEKLKIIKSELYKENFIHKECDLFNINQTNDLKSSNNKIIKEFYNFFSSKEFTNYINNITGIKIYQKIDMAGLLLQNTGYLLPHDDELEGRKIAYVVNLSEGFKNNNGGSLDLFDSKDNHPKKIIKSIIPSFNTLVLFKVSKISLHQISEVCVDKDRVSIGGWFHG